LIVAIEGCICSGKTTTATLVAEQLGLDLILEQTKTHPFLADFYADMERFKLETELGFVLLHYHQLHVLDSARRVVTDFSAVKDLMFAKMNLDGEDLDLFEYVYARLSGRLELPHLAVVLELPLDAIVERVRDRARSYEMSIPRSYLARLQGFYRELGHLLGKRVEHVALTGNESREAVAHRVIRIIHDNLLS
jgi:deoxyguanosine kinase